MGIHEHLIQSFTNFKNKFIGNIGNSTVAALLNNKAAKSEAIKNITRSGTTFTATRADNTTFTFDQRDNNTTTGTSYNAGSCPDNTTFGTNGSIARVFNHFNTKFSNYLVMRMVRIGYTIGGQNQWYTNLYNVINADLPAGYTCIGVVGFTTANDWVYVMTCFYENNNYALQLHNTSSNSISATARIFYLAAKL